VKKASIFSLPDHNALNIILRGDFFVTIKFFIFYKKNLGIFSVSILYEWRLTKKCQKNAKNLYAKDATLYALKKVTLTFILPHVNIKY